MLWRKIRVGLRMRWAIPTRKRCCGKIGVMVHRHAMIVSCATQIEELNAKVQELQTRHWEDANCRSELDMLKARWGFLV